jgi:signal recognition particle subunit SRP19
MANHARIEEISDSDSDPEIMDPDDPDIMDLSTFTSSNTFSSAKPTQNKNLINPSQIPSNANVFQNPARPAFDPAISKRWTCLYPIYFDAAKTRQEGRRVGKEQAVENPLARTIVDAVARLGLDVVFEATKLHPKDWANPGRIRVQLKDADGKIKRPNVKNSASDPFSIIFCIEANGNFAEHHLYLHVSAYLKQHPTTEDTPMELPIRGMPMPEKPPPPPSVPRGWKVNDILPLHSPAVTGGGVSENLLKEMMEGMGGGPAGPAGGGSSKKAKKQKIIRA